MNIVILNNDNKKLLLEFEKNIRISEPDIWYEEFNEEKYLINLEKSDFNTSNNIIICIMKEKQIQARCDVIIQESYMDFKKTAYIDWIYVEKTNRGEGFGKLLIDEAIKEIRKLGANYCYLFTAKNEEARNFYKKIEVLDLEKIEVAHKYFKR